MNLHRITGQSDWENIPYEERSSIQRLASKTYGLLTPGNIITVLGFVLSLIGLFQLIENHYLLGLIILIIGRLLDIADGVLADLTKTKSSVGEMFDAIADKVETFLTLIVLIVAHIAPWWIIAGIIIPQALITFVITYKRQRGKKIHPTLQGKLSMALAWIGIGGLVLSKAYASLPLIFIVFCICVFVSFILGVIALFQYMTESTAATS